MVARVGSPSDVVVLGDLGSTYTKLVAVDGCGDLLGQSLAPTSRHELDSGFAAALEQLADDVPGVSARRVILSSSAAGGLRLAIVGLEPSLTVRFGRMAAATAGGRIVGAFGLSEFETVDGGAWDDLAPDVVVLTGGTDGGEAGALPRAAAALRALGGRCPVVVAGNQDAYATTQRVLDGTRPVRYVANVMPRIGVLTLDEVRAAIRDAFIEHVMGHGRFASASSLVGNVAMPTPDAVLSAAEQLASLGHSEPMFGNPVVVDVGGATTDIHSVLPRARTLASGAGFGAGPRRTVEADLGMRESAEGVGAAAVDEGWIRDLDEPVAAALSRRTVDRGFVPGTPTERAIDSWLAGTATGLGLSRHAGVLQVQAGVGGIRVVPTGRDLRRASVVVATGGVFRHVDDAESVVSEALEGATEKGALVPTPSTPVLVDRSYVLWAAGLLGTSRPDAARLLLKQQLVAPSRGVA